LKKYDRAIATYKDGLKACPNDEHLLKGLAAAKRSAVDNSKATKAVRKTEATKKATKSRGKRAKSAEDVSDFVKQTRQELKLQMAAIQSQLDLINELAAMEEDEKLDLLFTLIDQDGDGSVDAKELATAMRKRNDELSFHDSIENAIDMVATFDVDGDAKLDHDEFRNYIHVMLKELGVNFSEFSEFLVIQILFSENKEDDDAVDRNNSKHLLMHNNIDEEVKAREVLFDMLSDERMVELFRLFDTVNDETGEILFSDVAVALYCHVILNGGIKDQSSSSSSSTSKSSKKNRIAYSLLLMMDGKDDTRTLNYEQFGRLIMTIVAVANCTFDDVADDLTVALTTMNAPSRDDKALSSLYVTDSIYQTTKDINRECKRKPQIGPGNGSSILMDPLSCGRLSKLFQLWDSDGDGNLTLGELTAGLQRFQNASGIDSCRDAKKDAVALFGFDADGDNKLDTKEFAISIVHYARCNNDIALHDLIDFMCVTSIMIGTGENSHEFQQAYGRALGKDVIPKLKMASTKFYDFVDDIDFS
jgi:Ca2+-binding EF-hand superfamily protein